MHLHWLILGLLAVLPVKAPSGPMVRSIEVHGAGASPGSEERVLAHMQIHVGQRYSEEAVDEDIRNLQKIRGLSRVRIFGEPVADGVGILVVVQPEAEIARRIESHAPARPVPLRPADPARLAPEPLQIELPLAAPNDVLWTWNGDAGHGRTFSIRPAPMEPPGMRIFAAPLVTGTYPVASPTDAPPEDHGLPAPASHPAQSQVKTNNDPFRGITLKLTQAGQIWAGHFPSSGGSVAGLRGLAMGILMPTVACLLAVLICWSSGRASAATRHLVWLLAFVSMAVGVPLTLFHVRVGVPVLPPISPPPAARAALPVFPWQAEPDQPGTIFIHLYAISLPKPLPAANSEPEVPKTSVGVPERPMLSWRTLPVVIWAGGWVVLSFQALVGVLRLRRILGQSRPAEDASLLALQLELGSLIGLRKPVRLAISGRVSVPLVTGLWRPCVVLPEEALAWPASARRAALLHELAHVRRNDLWSSAFARMVAALYWFHPLVWHGLRALRAEAEMAADDCVVTADSQPAAYAESLVTLVRHLRRGDASPFPAIGMLRRTGLQARVERILDPACRRSAPRQTMRWAALGGAALLGAGLSVVRPVAALPSPVHRMAIGAPAGSPGPFAPALFSLEPSDRPSWTPVVEPLSSNAPASPFDLPRKLNHVNRVVYDYSSWLRGSPRYNGNYNWNIDSPGPGYREQKARTLNQASPPTGMNGREFLD